MAVANVVAKFEADISDVQAKMAALKKSFSDVTDSTQSMSARLQTVGQDMAVVGRKMTLGVSLPLAAVGAAAVKTAMDFETSMSKIEGLVGVASDEVASMGETILETSAQFGVGANEAANALFFITSAGLRGADAMNVLEASMKASQVGLGDVATVADLATSAMNAYGPEALSATAATDVLTTAVREGKLEAQELAGSMGRVLPIASAMGVRFDEVGAAMAAMSRTGTNAAEASTQLRGILSSILRPTVQAEEALAGMGLSAEGLRAQIREEGLLATLQTLSEEFQGNDAAAAQVFGNVRALAGVMDLMGANSATTAAIFDSLTDSVGATDAAFAVTSETAQFRMNQALAEMKTALIDVGNAIMPVATTMIDFAKTALQAFNSLPGPIKTVIVAFGGILAAMGPILWIAGKMLKTLGVLGGAFVKLKATATTSIAPIGAQFKALEIQIKTAMIGAQTQMGALGAGAKVLGVQIAAGLRGAAVAVRGFIAAWGPIGLAITGVTLLIDQFMGRSAQLEGIVSSLREEVDLTTQSLTAAGEQLAAQEIFNLISEEDRAALEAYGISMAEVVDAVISGGPAMDMLQEKLGGFRDLEANPFGRMGADEIRQDIELVRAGVEGSIEAANALSEANDIAALRTSDAARAMAGSYRAAAAAKREADRNMTDSQRSLDEAMEAGIRAAEGLETAFMNLSDAMADEASIDGAYRAINRLSDTLNAGSGELKGYSDEALDNREAIRQAAQSWIDYAAAAEDPQESQRRLAEGQREIRDALKEAGIDPKDSDIFQTLKAQQQQSKETVDEFAKQRDKAAQYGNDVGNNFIDGIVQELARRKAEVAAAAAAVGDAMNTGTAGAIESQSPSRTAMRIAGDFTDGAVIGLRKGSGKVNAEARRIGNALNAAFAAALRPGAVGGPAGDAFSAIFGSRDEIRNSARVLQDATWDLADARDAVAEAEKTLAEARKEGTAREVAAAERDLARARRDAADAADAARTAEFVAENQKALLALEKITQKYDYIANALESVKGAMQGLVDLTATPFGLPSMLSEMFGPDTDARQMAGNFMQLTQMITDAYAVLTDPKIVGRGEARRNRRELNANLDALEGYVAQIISLRQELDAGLVREGELRTELAEVTRTFDEANRELERIVNERDGFMRKITSGFRSFVNNLSGITGRSAAELRETSRDLGNGVRLIMQSADPTSAAGAIAENLESRLNEVRAFTTNIRTLMQRGLDPALVRDFIESGVSGAGETVAALAGATDAELQAINATQAELLAHAEQFATDTGASFYGPLIAGQQSVVDGLQAQVNAAQSALDTVESRNKELADNITEIGQSITTMVEGLATELPARTLQAGQDAVDAMMTGFGEKFPEMKTYFNRLMDNLAKSMRRTVIVDVQTRGAITATRSSAATFNTGSVPLASPVSSRSVTVSPNAVNVTVNGGTGDSRAMAVEVKRAIDESLQELALEIAAS